MEKCMIKSDDGSFNGSSRTLRLLTLAFIFSATLGSASAQLLFVAEMDGDQAVPPAASLGDGNLAVTLNAAETSISVSGDFFLLSGNATNAHIHGPASPGAPGAVIFTLGFTPTNNTGAFITNQTFTVNATQRDQLKAGLWYVDVHTTAFPSGEIRGQILCSSNITVISTNDSGAGTLRQAIVDACTNGTITFAVALNGKTITLTNGELLINKNLSIVGNGATNLTVNGNAAGRIFRITNGTSTVNISGLSISNGNAGAFYGGGILNQGTGSVHVAFCSLSGNSAAAGGAIANTNHGQFILSQSAVFNNSAMIAGGGILGLDSGTLVINNSTISSNIAVGLLGLGGAGLASECSVTINNSTISSNTVLAGMGGGIQNSDPGVVTLLNSIVSGNASASDPDLSGLFVSLGHNIIGNTNGATGFVASDLPNVNPRLGPLRNNGGQTLTHALLTGSPAINAGDNSVTNPPLSLLTDQRGLPRVEEVDIGAFELQAGSPFFVNCPTNVLVLPNDPGLCSATFVPNLIAIGPPKPVISCNPTSGASLHLGTNMITCTAVNPSGTTNCTFKIAVIDTEPPVLTCTNVVVNHTDLNGAIVNFASPVVMDNCTTVIGTNCSPGPGHFPIGANDISCTATDAVGNVGTCKFRVLVLGARTLKTNVLAELKALLAASTNERDQERLEDAIENLARSLASGLFIDDDHLRAKDGSQVFGREKEAVEKLLHLVEDNDRSDIPIGTLEDLIDQLVRADRLLAALAIHEAQQAGAPAAAINQAEHELAEGDEELAEGDFEHAISEYGDAWKAVARPRITGTVTLANGIWRMDCMGLPGLSCSIQATSDFVTWTIVHTSVIGADGRMIFEDPSAGSRPARFYRVVANAAY